MAKRIKNYCSEVFMYGIAEGNAAAIRRRYSPALRKPRPKSIGPHSPSEFPTLVARMHAYDGDELTKLALLFTSSRWYGRRKPGSPRIDEFENLEGQESLWR